MKIPKVDNCCCCLSTRTGSLIIGILSLIGPVIMIIVASMLKVDKESAYKEFLEPVKIIVIVISSISLIISIFLILGTLKRNTTMMLPWVVLTVVGIIINVAFTLYNTIALSVAGAVGPALISFFITMIGVVISIYFWLVIYTYFRELKDDALNGRLSA